MLKNADWQITSTCNRSCAYCFGPQTMKEMPKDSAFRCVDILEQMGIQQIGITGGEPLLCDYFEPLIEYIHNKGIRIYLSTNCDYFMLFSELIKDKVDILGISIDGHCAKCHDYQRGAGNFDAVISTIKDVFYSESKIKLKIGTVLTKDNIAYLTKIEKLLAAYTEKILYWKLYEMISYDRNFAKVKSLIPNQEIKFPDLGQFLDINKIIDDKRSLRSKGYFFIRPNGDVFVPLLNDDISKEKVIGNILQENCVDSILEGFYSVVEWQNYNAPFRFMGKSEVV